MEAFFSPILRYSQKKKKRGPSSKFCNFSPQFLRHTRARCREPRLSKVFGGRKNAEIRKNLVRKCRKKFCTFLRL